MCPKFNILLTPRWEETASQPGSSNWHVSTPKDIKMRRYVSQKSTKHAALFNSEHLLLFLHSRLSHK